MLSIGKLAAGQQDYYLSAVAAGVEDYYLGTGEAPGSWIGQGAGRLGLSGQVQPDALGAVLDGRAPGSDSRLTRTRKGRRIPGWDLTFSAPKSVSLLYALGPPALRRIVTDAHDRAVQDAFTYLEAEAGFVRRGDGGLLREPGAGLIGAAFRHRTSRAADPQLHTHVLLSNLVATQDGAWRAVHSKAFYLHARAAGALYRAILRDTLTRQLGVSWRPRPHGLYEIAGIPQPVLRAFSRRRQAIETSLTEHRATSGWAGRTATLTTRTSKTTALPTQELHDRWRARADLYGFPPAELATLLTPEHQPMLDADFADRPHRDSDEQPGKGSGQGTRQGFGQGPALPQQPHQSPNQHCRPPVATANHEGPVGAPLTPPPANLPAKVLPAEQLIAGLLGPDGLTRHASVFRRRDVTRALCDLLPDGAPAHTIRALTEQLLTHPDVIPLPPSEQVKRDGETRNDERMVFTTRQLQQIEQRIMTITVTGRQQHRAVVPAPLLHQGLRSARVLSGEQERMVSQLCRSGNVIDIIIGTPGAGKTRGLAAAHHAWHTAKYPVLGCAVKASAAAELQAGARIPSFTVARLLADLDHSHPDGQPSGLPAGTVLIVDEAGMLGTRHLDRILDHVLRAHGKLVLIGDPKQLPSIDAGGLLPYLAQTLNAVTLTGNRRQTDPADQTALQDYRDGNITAALASYATRGRLHVHSTPDAQRTAMVTAWWNDQQAGIPSVMLAYRRVDIHQLNTLARQHLQAAGTLTGPTLTIPNNEHGDREFQVGDVVLLRRNNYPLGVLNGDHAHITTITPTGGKDEISEIGSVTVTLRRTGQPVTLPTGYLTGDTLDHGYATTIHASQGTTITRTHILGNDALFHEAGLVALSRHQDTCHLHLAEPNLPDRPDPGVEVGHHLSAEDTPGDSVEEFTRTIARSRAQTPTLEYDRDNNSR